MYINYPAQHHICYTHTLWCLLDTLSGQRRTRPPTNMVRGSWGIFRQIDFLSSMGGINEKIVQSNAIWIITTQRCHYKIIRNYGLWNLNKTWICHSFLKGPINSCDLSLFQLSLLGQEGGGNFSRFFYGSRP